MMEKTYSGFVAIIGPTNAGKSTLLNQIMGRKVSIVSHKVQTTRTRLRAVKMVGAKQLIFVDTPGVFKPSRRLDRAMVAAAMDAVSDADAALIQGASTEKFQNAILQLDSVQVELRNTYLAYKEKYQQVDAQYEQLKAERKATNKTVKALEKKIKQIESTKSKIRKTMQ